MQRHKVVIIGGGYAGLRALARLARHDTFEIVLLDKNPYHYQQTEVYDFIANETDFSKVTTDLFTFCMGFGENVTFFKQEVNTVDVVRKKVITDVQRFSYDTLIIAAGSRTRFIESIPGLSTYAYGVKSLKRALYFKQKFEQSLFNKIQDEGTACKPLHIIIGGAGLSGVEIAAQMASFARSFYKNNHFLCRKLDIVLVNAAPHILAGVDALLVKWSIRRLKQLGVIIKNDRKIVAVASDCVTLSDGEILPMDFMIFVGGIKPSKVIEAMPLAKTPQGTLATNDYLQCRDHKDIYALGDCTTISRNGSPLAPTADIAEQMAEVCANNILRSTLNLPLAPHKIKPRGMLIALGQHYAVGKVSTIRMRGWIAFAVKKSIETYYTMTLHRRSAQGCKKIFLDL